MKSCNQDVMRMIIVRYYFIMYLDNCSHVILIDESGIIDPMTNNLLEEFIYFLSYLVIGIEI